MSGKSAQGGQAIVYEATQESTTQRVALKLLRWGKLASTQEHARLRREVVILAQLSHPGIASIIDSGETENGVFFIATQFVDGHRLDQLLDLSASEAGLFGNNSEDEYRSRILQLFLKVCNAVDAAHRAGVVHRDLKPASILIDKRGEPRVVDFGLAKSGFQEHAAAADPKGITQSGLFMGSLPWASPEQASGDAADERSDVYSLGVILYQLVSGGQFPYDVTGSMSDVIARIMRSHPKSLVQTGRQSGRAAMANWPKVQQVDAQLNAMVMKALAKSREERYQTAGEFGEAVGQYLNASRDGSATHSNLKGRSTKNLVTAALTVVILVGCLSAALPSLLRLAGSGEDATSVSSHPEAASEVEWESLASTLSEVVDDDSITKTNNGWRIRERSVLLPDVNSDVLIWRVLLRRNSDGPITLRLEAQAEDKEAPDEIISIEASGRRGDEVNRIELTMDGKRVVNWNVTCPVSAEGPLELTLAVKPDRVTVMLDGRLMLQLHSELMYKTWRPVLDARSADIDLIATDYAQPTTVPKGFTGDVIPIELAALEFIVRHGGAAISRPVSTTSAKSKFQLVSLTTDGSEDALPAGEIPKIAHCSMLERIELQRVTDSIEAVEHIAKLKRLKTLYIAYSSLPSNCFHYVAQLEQLENIDFFRTVIPEADFGPLRRLPSLTKLWVPSVPVSDADLELLSQIRTLRRISGARRSGHLAGRAARCWVDGIPVAGASVCTDCRRRSKKPIKARTIVAAQHQRQRRWRRRHSLPRANDVPRSAQRE